MMRVSLPVYVNFAHLVDDRSGLFSWFCSCLFLKLKGVLYLLVCRIDYFVLFLLFFYCSHICFIPVI
jgi:hypothetical protein